MKYLMMTGVSFMLTSLVIGNAFYQKNQFYPSVVYITKSNPSMAVMYIQALVFVVLMAKLLGKVFFGQLRAAEMEHLIERSWYAITETCLAFTVFRDDFSPRFVALFTLLLCLKCFHWLAEDRIDYMERSPAISWLFHLRALALMFVLGLLDILFVRHAFYSTISKGPSVQLVFGFEYEILLTVVLMIFIKYMLHTIDLQSENPWDNKAMYLLYSELVIGSIRVLLYIMFFAVMIKVHTFPLFAIRPMYLSLRAFQKAASDVILSRRAIRNMNTLYPDATPEELSAGDNLCIICREEMTTGCKKLPCNHILHTNCLRSWFQRQQTCPTCRLEVLRMPNQRQQQQQQQQPAAPAQPQAQPPQPPFNNMPGMFGGFPFQWPPNVAPGQAAQPPFAWPPQAHQQAQQQQQQTSAASSTSITTSHAAAGSSATSTTTSATTNLPHSSTTTTPPSMPPMPPTFGMGMPPFAGMPPTAGMPPFAGMPPMAGMPPFMHPTLSPAMGATGFPPPPCPLGGLSEEELKEMEGTERINVEARVMWLRDIQTLLDGAMVLIEQYNSVARHMGSPGIFMATSATSSPQSQAASSVATSTSNPVSSATTSQLQSTWWPSGTGARPKYSSTATSQSLQSPLPTTVSGGLSSDKQFQQVKDDATSVQESATSTSSTNNLFPKSDGTTGEEVDDEKMQEIRKRRLQHFSSKNDNHKSEGVIDES